MQKSDCYFLGTISKLHGLKGHVVLSLDTDEPELYHTMESIWVEFNAQLVPFFIEEITPLGKEKIRLKINHSEPETLIGKLVFQPLSSLPPLEGKKFYYHEIIGYSLIHQKDTVGIIEAVNDYANPALLQIKREDKEHLVIPIINDWIVSVNRDEKTLEMDLPDGITDL